MYAYVCICPVGHSGFFVADFLAAAMSISSTHIQASWDILKAHLWTCSPPPLVDADHEAFKLFGWEKGLSEQQILYQTTAQQLLWIFQLRIPFIHHPQ